MTKSLNDRINELQDQLESVTSERDALAAHANISMQLAEHDAEVAKKAFIAGYDNCYEAFVVDGLYQSLDPDCDAEEKSEEYADQIKRGEV